MIYHKCPNCDETAIEICPRCGNQSFCPSCDDCFHPGCSKDQDKGLNVHLTVRIDLETNSRIEELLKNQLKNNPFVKKADIIRELLIKGLNF